MKFYLNLFYLQDRMFYWKKINIRKIDHYTMATITKTEIKYFIGIEI